MGHNQLKVNDDKTVALVLSSRNNRVNHNIVVIKIADCDITPSPTGRDIGVIFDTEMSMVSHVERLAETSALYLTQKCQWSAMLNDLQKHRRYI